jgi:hypothetical protein
MADGRRWFVLREEYCWLVADKPSEQAVSQIYVILYTFILKSKPQQKKSSSLHNFFNKISDLTNYDLELKAR